MKVLQIINKIQGELSKTGIAKNSKNQQQGYSFRGIDEIYNNLAPLFADKGLVIVPHYYDWKQEERTTRNGGILLYTKVCGRYEIFSSEDGSKIEADLVGEAMDSADKSTNKAMSAAYKYLCLQLFSIPIAGDNDPDETTHNMRPQMVTSEQLDELGRLGTDFPKMMEFFKIESPNDLTYKQAKELITKKIEKLEPVNRQ